MAIWRATLNILLFYLYFFPNLADALLKENAEKKKHITAKTMLAIELDKNSCLIRIMGVAPPIVVATTNTGQYTEELLFSFRLITIKRYA